jgi:hypothetical protein
MFISTYPNPVVDMLNITFGAGIEGVVSVDVISPTGVSVLKVFRGNVEKDQLYTNIIDVSSLESGIYLVTVRSSKGTATSKVVIANSN